MSKLTNVKYNKPSFWEDFFGSNWYNEPYSNGFMRSDVSKRKGNYVFDIDIPGYSKEDIQVKLDYIFLDVSIHNQIVLIQLIMNTYIKKDIMDNIQEVFMLVVLMILKLLRHIIMGY